MSNTSATGGPILPTGGVVPLEGQALSRFLQQWIAPLLGLEGPMVRPRWQAEPPNIPAAGEAWASIGITERSADAFPSVTHDPSGDGLDILIRHERLELLVSVYDLGVNGQADNHAALLRDNLLIPQNSEPLSLAGFALVQTGTLTTVPSLLKSRWLYRVDLPITIRRAVARSYPVLNLLQGQATIVSGDPAGRTLTVPVTVTNS
ncbi:phage neck terminator protein [Azospirillum argentinense]